MNTNPSNRSANCFRVAACAAIAFFGVQLATAQAPVVRDDRTVTTRTTTKPALKRADKDFFEKAAKAGMEEVEISRVAAQRSTNPEVKRLADMIIADHQAANDELATLAAACGVALPAKDIAPENKWAKHDAGSFDKDYLDKMVNAHEDAVKLFDREARNGDDAEAVAFARKHLPAMQHHLQAALDLKRALK
jgi:putative membrane protein